MNKYLDWSAIIYQLNKAGITSVEITRKTGINKSMLSAVKNELSESPEQWNQALELLDLYLKVMNCNPPRLGDHVDMT